MIFTTFCSITFILIKLAEKKQKKKNAGHQNDETVVHSSNNAPVDDSQKALTGDVFGVFVAYSPMGCFVDNLLLQISSLI